MGKKHKSVNFIIPPQGDVILGGNKCKIYVFLQNSFLLTSIDHYVVNCLKCKFHGLQEQDPCAGAWPY